MGNSCSSGQAHKDKDNMSQRSEESGSYQVRTSLPTDKQKVLMNHVTATGCDTTTVSHTGILLEPATAGLSPGASITSNTSKHAAANKTLRGVAVTSVSDSMSLSSPPGAQSPRGFDKTTPSGPDTSHLPPEVAQLSEQLQHLIMGRVAHCKTVGRTRKIVVYVCAADSQDCCVEKGNLHNVIYPELRMHCRAKGYELHIVDLHWRSLLEKQQDHEFPELCIGELQRQMEVAYVIPVLFLNNSLGTSLLPISIEQSDFQLALDSVEDAAGQALLVKWYQLDSAAQPPCFRLQPISCHIPGFKETSAEDRETALEEWRSEIDKMLSLLTGVFSQELRDTYLTTVVEQEVHNTVFMSQELAKRCIWINRVYTPTEKTPDNMDPVEAELHRRLHTLQRDLRNQLAEKHIVRLPVRYVEGGLNMEIQEHAEYIESVEMYLSKHLTEMVDCIIDEHQSKTMLKPAHGIDVSVFEELNQQTTFCQKAAQCSVNRERTIEEIRAYITTENHSPLVIHGPGGCGKTTLLARLAQCCLQWQPEAFLVFRFVGISAQSNTLEQLLCSIVHQCSILTYGCKACTSHTIESYAKALPSLLAASCLQRPVIVLIDGIDQTKSFSSTALDWLPTKLPDNVKLLLSVTEGSEMHREMQRKLGANAFIKMPVLGESEAKGILMSSVVQYNHSVNSKIQDCVLKSVQECTLPLYSKVLAWQTSWWADMEHDIVPKGDVDNQLALMLEELEMILGSTQVQHALALLTFTKHGITDSEMIDLLSFDETFHTNTTFEVSVNWAPACLMWSRLNKNLAPFLQWQLVGTVLGVQWRDNMLYNAVKARYKENETWAHQMLYDYYNGKWWSEKPPHLVARLVSQQTILGKCYNRRKLDELPYQYFYLKWDKLPQSEYLNDLDWIYEKVCGSSCFQLLEDIFMCYNRDTPDRKFLALLRDFLQDYVNVLNYDGRQFYAHLCTFLKEKMKCTAYASDAQVAEVYAKCCQPPVHSLIPTNDGELLTADICGAPTTSINRPFDLIVRLPGSDDFIVTVATEREEICVWNVKTNECVRRLKGVPHPINLIPIDQHRCIVLCRRELRVYNLEEGTFVTKLKGVMNQKMPFYGLHDASHLVALSRNRMYVNLMNLETGDCVTTFKAGEDRFLNSLLVSGDGRVLVCGDETQKPFPLLVWNLQSRKLLYDLRIPHHDFITSLAAITYEGNYVCCVCHEIDEPNPNFIVVYDLQSGTLFKKWKPSCDTVALEISSQGGCVISGLADARILVWDLITGNCRWSLQGHTAPVDMLKLDAVGALCLSTDLQGRDKSIRVWDLEKGNLLAVYTTHRNIISCEIQSHAHHVVLALDGREQLTVLRLHGPDVAAISEEEVCYGDATRTGAEFEVKDDNC